jgi:hypothetical protein
MFSNLFFLADVKTKDEDDIRKMKMDFFLEFVPIGGRNSFFLGAY